MHSLRREFSVNGHDYLLSIDLDGSVQFALIRSGPPSTDIYDLFRHEPQASFADENVHANAFAVFRLVTDAIVEFVHRSRPPMLTFTAADARRTRLYDWMAKRVQARVPDYYCYRFGSEFYFYREA